MQASLLVNDHPASMLIEFKVSATGEYVWGRAIITEHSGRQRRIPIPHTFFGASLLGLPDDMRDIWTAWLYHSGSEVATTIKRSIERWQDDCDDQGDHLRQ